MTFLIILIFGGGPLAVFILIVVGAVHRARQHKKLYDAADKFLKS
jgi:hypothetical protein